MDKLPPLSPPRLRGLLFDLDGTLVDRDRAVLRWARTRRPATEDAVRGAPGFRCATDDDVRRFLCWCGCGDLAAGDFHAAIAATVRASAGADALLAALVAASVPIGVVTNGGRLQGAKLVSSGLAPYFAAGRVWISAVEGARKPDPSAFLAGARAIGCAPHEVLFVGDDPVVDIAGATAVGMRGWRVGPGAGLPELLEAWRSWT